MSQFVNECRTRRAAGEKIDPELLQTYAAEVLADAPQVGTRWQHYRGGEYEVIICAIDEATLNVVVVYRSLKYGYPWMRSLRSWSEEVDGRPRFSPVI